MVPPGHTSKSRCRDSDSLGTKLDRCLMTKQGQKGLFLLLKKSVKLENKPKLMTKFNEKRLSANACEMRVNKRRTNDKHAFPEPNVFKQAFYFCPAPSSDVLPNAKLNAFCFIAVLGSRIIGNLPNLGCWSIHKWNQSRLELFVLELNLIPSVCYSFAIINGGRYYWNS